MQGRLIVYKVEVPLLFMTASESSRNVASGSPIVTESTKG